LHSIWNAGIVSASRVVGAVSTHPTTSEVRVVLIDRAYPGQDFRRDLAIAEVLVVIISPSSAGGTIALETARSFI
jgi:hypothetical protein